MKYEDGYSDGGMSNAAATFYSVGLGLAAFTIGIGIFLVAVIAFKALF